MLLFPGILLVPFPDVFNTRTSSNFSLIVLGRFFTFHFSIQVEFQAEWEITIFPLTDEWGTFLLILTYNSELNVSINSIGAHPPRAFVGHFQLYLFSGSGICFLQVSPGVGNLLKAKKSNICRLFRHLAVFQYATHTRPCVLQINHGGHVHFRLFLVHTIDTLTYFRSLILLSSFETSIF